MSILVLSIYFNIIYTLHFVWRGGRGRFPWPSTDLLGALAKAYYNKQGGAATTAALRCSSRGDITRLLLTHKITPDYLNKHSLL